MNKKKAKALFNKYLNNNCSKEELNLLENFLDSYQSKNLLWDELKFGAEKEFKKNTWSKIETKINKARQHKLVLFKTYLKYAAAASIILFVSITFFFQNKQTHKSANPTVVETGTIETGTDKATLTLEDGSNIALEKGKTYNTNNVNSDGEALVYASKEEQSHPEVVYNFLTIPRGGQFFVKLSDGTQVWLNSESQLKYPVNFISGKPRQVELVYGEAYFDVSPSTEHQGSTFMVQSKGQNIEVLGTEFNIKAYKDEVESFTTLVEGKIALNTNKYNQILQPNEQAICNPNEQTIQVNTVDVYNEVSWKDGVFSFERKPLKDIMKVLSRWYDMNVVFENEALEDVKFIGVLSKGQKIDNIITTIVNLGFINSYKIENKTIILK